MTLGLSAAQAHAEASLDNVYYLGSGISLTAGEASGSANACAGDTCVEQVGDTATVKMYTQVTPFMISSDDSQSSGGFTIAVPKFLDNAQFNVVAYTDPSKAGDIVVPTSYRLSVAEQADFQSVTFSTDRTTIQSGNLTDDSTRFLTAASANGYANYDDYNFYSGSVAPFANVDGTDMQTRGTVLTIEITGTVTTQMAETYVPVRVISPTWHCLLEVCDSIVGDDPYGPNFGFGDLPPASATDPAVSAELSSRRTVDGLYGYGTCNVTAEGSSVAGTGVPALDTIYADIAGSSTTRAERYDYTYNLHLNPAVTYYLSGYGYPEDSCDTAAYKITVCPKPVIVTETVTPPPVTVTETTTPAAVTVTATEPTTVTNTVTNTATVTETNTPAPATVTATEPTTITNTATVTDTATVTETNTPAPATVTATEPTTITNTATVTDTATVTETSTSVPSPVTVTETEPTSIITTTTVTAPAETTTATVTAAPTDTVTVAPTTVTETATATLTAAPTETVTAAPTTVTETEVPVDMPNPTAAPVTVTTTATPAPATAAASSKSDFNPAGLIAIPVVGGLLALFGMQHADATVHGSSKPELPAPGQAAAPAAPAKPEHSAPAPAKAPADSAPAAHAPAESAQAAQAAQPAANHAAAPAASAKAAQPAPATAAKAPQRTLANTGASVFELGAMALLLVVAGAALLLLVRRHES